MSATIIVAVTSSDAAGDALAYATDLARMRDARVVLAGVAVVPRMAERDIYAAARRGELERDLDLLLGTMAPDVEARATVVVSSSVSRGLHTLAEEEDADLLVLGPTHRGALERTFRGDVVLGTLHGAHCAVAVAPAGYATRVEHGPLRVAVAIDGEAETTRVLEYAVEVARIARAQLEIVCVAENAVSYAGDAWTGTSASVEFYEAIARSARAVLQEALATVDERVPVTTRLLEGAPGPALARHAHDVDLLVMGSRAHGPLGRVLLGSTAGHVLHHADTAVIVVPQRAAPVAVETA